MSYKKENKAIDILSGNINKVLLALALPMIASNFVQTALGLIDMVWIGSLGSQSVSAVGTASFYINLATAISTLITVGVGVKYAQHVGSKQQHRADDYLKAGILLASLLSIVYVLFNYIFARSLISFFNLQDIHVAIMAKDFLRNSLPGIPFLFFSLTFVAVLTSKGNTKIIFIANTVGLVANLLLDPLFIFGLKNLFPAFGIVGAAWATNIARVITFIILLISMRGEVFKKFSIWNHKKDIKDILKMGFPVAVQRITFIFISMYLARIIATYGNTAIAAQKIGVQIESISYVTIGGLQGAIAAFIGQNYGAKSYDRVKKGYSKAVRIAVIFSLIVSFFFIAFPKELFSIFISEERVIEVGIGYMRAIGLSQLFMCVEYITVGVFNGIGLTYIPPIISIILTALRIPMAIILTNVFGVDGVWMSISISSVLKGVVMFTWMKTILRKGGVKKEELKTIEWKFWH